LRISRANNNIKDKIEDPKILITDTGEKNRFKRDNTEKKSILFQGKKRSFTGLLQRKHWSGKKKHIYIVK
jgi:hypothetical protein